MRSITFYLDIMAVLPLEIFAPAFSDPWEFVLVLKLNRLLKLWKVKDVCTCTLLFYSTILNLCVVWHHHTEYEQVSLQQRGKNTGYKADIVDYYYHKLLWLFSVWCVLFLS